MEPAFSPTPQAPVGIFDSGLGGLSVWREIVVQLPAEATLYVADQAHIPYGPRSVTEIRRFAHVITGFLLARGAKAIVVACNTASGAALHALRAAYPEVPFVGMEPAVKPAVEQSATRTIGVLATPTTFEGDLFRRLVDRFGRQVEIHTRACPGLVEAVEAGATAAPETVALVRRCLAPLIDQRIDQLVLGCTHYPFVREAIESVLGPSIAVIDPAPAVARQLGRVLVRSKLSNPDAAPGRHCFYTSGAPDLLAQVVWRLTGASPSVEALRWQCGAADTRLGEGRLISLDRGP